MDKKELLDKISVLDKNLKDTASKIEGTLSAKIEAKKHYEHSLDGGDPDGMNDALAQIRTSNAERESLISGLSNYESKISELRLSWEKLIERARQKRDEAEKKLRDFQIEFTQLKTDCDSVHGLLDLINDLSRNLTRIKDRYTPENVQAEPEKS